MQPDTLISRISQALRKSNSDYLLLGALILAIAAANLIWAHLETRPPHWDMGRHLLYSLKYKDDFLSGNIPYWIGAYRYYPPFLYWITAPFYTLFGTGTLIAVLSIQVWMGILVLATYGIGKQLWGRGTGLLAALFRAVLPEPTAKAGKCQLSPPS